MNVKITRMLPKHADQAVRLGEDFWEQTSYHKQGIVYDEEVVKRLVSQVMRLGIAQVAIAEERVVGFILLLMGPVIFSPSTKLATELAFYVSPEARGAGAGKALLKQAENVAKQQGVRLLNMLHLDSVSPDKPESIYKDMSYVKTETLFTKDIS